MQQLLLERQELLVFVNNFASTQPVPVSLPTLVLVVDFGAREEGASASRGFCFYWQAKLFASGFKTLDSKRLVQLNFKNNKNVNCLTIRGVYPLVGKL